MRELLQMFFHISQKLCKYLTFVNEKIFVKKNQKIWRNKCGKIFANSFSSFFLCEKGWCFLSAYIALRVVQLCNFYHYLISHRLVALNPRNKNRVQINIFMPKTHVNFSFRLKYFFFLKAKRIRYHHLTKCRNIQFFIIFDTNSRSYFKK